MASAIAPSPNSLPRRSTRKRPRSIDETTAHELASPSSTSISTSKRRKATSESKQQERQPQLPAQQDDKANEAPVLLDLGAPVWARVLRRPSATIKSPYVADVVIDATQQQTMAHSASLGLSGLIAPGTRVLLTPAAAAKTSKNASSSAAGASQPTQRRTTHTVELVLIEEPESGESIDGWPSYARGGAVLVGANPQLANRIAAAALAAHLIPELGDYVLIEREKAHLNSRVDFVLHYDRPSSAQTPTADRPEATANQSNDNSNGAECKENDEDEDADANESDGDDADDVDYGGGGVDDRRKPEKRAASAKKKKKSSAKPKAKASKKAARSALPTRTGPSLLLEVKNVVLADYFEPTAPADRKVDVIPARPGQPYKRSAVFPDGYKKPGADTVSERANKHLRELTHAALHAPYAVTPSLMPRAMSSAASALTPTATATAITTTESQQPTSKKRNPALEAEVEVDLSEAASASDAAALNNSPAASALAHQPSGSLGSAGAAVLFVINRGDCHSLRPCWRADRVFSEELVRAASNGVKVLACKIEWTTEGKALWRGMVPVDLEPPELVSMPTKYQQRKQ